MSVLVTSSGSLETPLVKVGTNTGPDAANTFTLASDTDVGDGICYSSWATGPGQFGTFAIKVSHPSSTPDFSVKLAWQTLDAVGTVIDSAEDATATVVTLTAKTMTITLPAAAANAATRRIYINAASAPPSPTRTPSRTNYYQGARCTATTLGDWDAQSSWVLSARTTGTGLPPNLTTYIRNQSVETAAGLNRGFLWYQSVSPTNPVSGKGWALPAGWTGQTHTFSFYVLSTKATIILPTVRFFHGTTWDGARVDGAQVSIAAGTWTRVSVSAAAPAGATNVCGWLLANTTVSWVPADYMAVSAVYIQRNTGTLAAYFDGNNLGTNPVTNSVAWDGEADLSYSTLYAEANPVRKLTVSGDVLGTTATAEALLSADLERNLRRSVAEIFNSSTARIAAGTPSLLSGSLTFLCNTWAQAKTLDALHQTIGTITLGGPDSSDLSGLRYVSIETNQLTAEEATPGLPSKWLVQVQIREQP